MPKLEITAAKLRSWIMQLHPGGEPEIGSHSIILCQNTGAIFASQKETEAYTFKTHETDFAIIWVKVELTPDGGWTVRPRKGNRKPEGEEKAAEDAARNKARQEKEKAKAKAAGDDFATALQDVDNAKKDKAAAAKLSSDELMASAAQREAMELAKKEKAAADKAAKEAAQKARQAAREEERKKKREAEKERARATAAAAQDGLKPASSSIPVHKKVFGMWANDKLVKSGNMPIKVANLEDEMRDGTKLAELLEALMGVKFKDVDRKPTNPLQVAANYHVLFRKMQDDGIDLGGINPQNLMAEEPLLKADLALLWRLIQKYELVDDSGLGEHDGLLAWCKPKIAPKKDVTNFNKDWLDGDAFLALLESLVPGTVDWSKLDALTPEKKMDFAFQKFLNEMGVPMLLEAGDLLDKNASPTDMKQSIMCYVGAIRNADGNKMVGAEKDFNDAKAKYVQALLDARAKEEELYSDAKQKITDCVYGEANDVDAIIADAINALAPTSEKFIECKADFDRAMQDFLDMKTEAGNQRADDCRKAGSEAIAQPPLLADMLQNGLLNLKDLWSIRAEIDEGDAIVLETDKIMDGLVSQIGDWAKEEVTKSSGEDARAELREKAKSILLAKAEPLLEAKEHYKKAHDLSEDSVIKRECLSKLHGIDGVLEGYADQVDEVVNAAIYAEDANKKAGSEDVLKIYHEFSQRVEALAKKLDALPTGDVPRTPGVAEQRLAEILSCINRDWERDLTLRWQLHVALDQTFTNEIMP